MKAFLILLFITYTAAAQDTVKPLRDTVIKGNPKDTIHIIVKPDSAHHKGDTIKGRLYKGKITNRFPQ